MSLKSMWVLLSHQHTELLTLTYGAAVDEVRCSSSYGTLGKGVNSVIPCCFCAFTREQ